MPAMSGCVALTSISLNSNKELKALPSTICSLSKLKKLVASDCDLSGRIYF
jgi:hypothetical protein